MYSGIRGQELRRRQFTSTIQFNLIWAHAMTRTLKVGDHVSWNSEASRIRGRIVKVHRKDIVYKGYIHHASEEEPQYQIESDKTDHVACIRGRLSRGSYDDWPKSRFRMLLCGFDK